MLPILFFMYRDIIFMYIYFIICWEIYLIYAWCFFFLGCFIKYIKSYIFKTTLNISRYTITQKIQINTVYTMGIKTCMCKILKAAINSKLIFF